MISKIDLIDKFKEIGIQKGDTLFLRISYKSLGEIEGGPNTVVDALLDCVGESGNLIVTAYGGKSMSPYLYRRIFQSKVFYEKGKIENIGTGIIPVTLAKHPSAYWSNHPSYPYIAVGKDAKKITKNHTPDSDPYGLLLDICENYNAKTLRLGGYILTGTTHVSFTESMISSNSTQRIPKNIIYYYDERKSIKIDRSRHSAFCFDSYDKFFRNNILQNNKAVLFHGEFLKTEATLMSMKEVLFMERKLLNGHPELLLCENPDCLFCPHTFSYSKHKVDYITIRLRRIISGNKQSKIKALKDILKYVRDLVFIRRDIQ